MTTLASSSAAAHARRIPALLFLLVWVSAAWFGSWEFNPNNATRLFAAISLVERHDARIDDFAALTIDKATFDGHVYLDKAPGMTLMALPAVALADAVTGDRSARHELSPLAPDFVRFIRLRLRLAAITGPALLTALAAVLLYDLGLAITGRADAALVAALGYALGTPIWGWSTTILGHAAVAALYVIAVWGFRRTVVRGSVRAALLDGAALGWAVVVEYQAVLAGFVIAAGAAWMLRGRPDRVRLLVWATIGGVAALLPLVGYNLLAFGTPWRIGYAGVVGFEGMKQGYFGLIAPRPRVLLEILLGDRRGLVWVAPVLLAAPLGLAAMADVPRTRALAATVAAAVVVVLLVNAAYVYWDGGNATGPRHAMPVAGLLALGLAPWWAALRQGWARIAGVLLLAVSIGINAVIAAADIFAPPEYRWPVWTDVVRLWFARGDVRTWPGEWFGWTGWGGFALYGAVALPLLAALVVLVARDDSVRCGSS